MLETSEIFLEKNNLDENNLEFMKKYYVPKLIGTSPQLFAAALH